MIYLKTPIFSSFSRRGGKIKFSGSSANFALNRINHNSQKKSAKFFRPGLGGVGRGPERFCPRWKSDGLGDALRLNEVRLLSALHRVRKCIKSWMVAQSFFFENLLSL